MDKNNELLPCPFCGTQPKEQASLGVWCDHDDCAIMGQVFSGGASHWNRRAASPAALTDSKIEGIWMTLDRSGSNDYSQPDWEREMRRRFARALLAASPAGQGVDARDTERLDYVLSNSAFTVWRVRDRSIKQVQLYTQDEDEEYHILSGAERYFNTERDAIDAAMSASKEGA